MLTLVLRNSPLSCLAHSTVCSNPSVSTNFAVIVPAFSFVERLVYPPNLSFRNAPILSEAFVIDISDVKPILFLLKSVFISSTESTSFILCETTLARPLTSFTISILCNVLSVTFCIVALSESAPVTLVVLSIFFNV